MEWIFVILVVLAVLFKAVTKFNKPRKGNHGYRKRGELFSAAEEKFLISLDEAVSDKYRVFGKVRVADVITPEKGLDRSNWQVAFNKISAKHFDYILCSKDDLKIVAAVELDDKSHLSKKVKLRDAFLESACESANLKLIRFPAKTIYDTRTINERIEAKISISGEQ